MSTLVKWEVPYMASKVTGFYVFASTDKNNVYATSNRSALLAASARSWRDVNLFAGANARYYGIRSMYADGTYVDSPIKTIRIPPYLGYGSSEVICGDFEWGHFQTAKNGDVSLLDGVTVLSNRNPQIKVAFEGRVMIIDTQPVVTLTGQTASAAFNLIKVHEPVSYVTAGEYLYQKRISQKQDVASVLSLRLAGMGTKHDVYPLICPWPANSVAYQTNTNTAQLLWAMNPEQTNIASWYDTHTTDPKQLVGGSTNCYGVALAVYELVGLAE